MPAGPCPHAPPTRPPHQHPRPPYTPGARCCTLLSGFRDAGNCNTVGYVLHWQFAYCDSIRICPERRHPTSVVVWILQIHILTLVGEGICTLEKPQPNRLVWKEWKHVSQRERPGAMHLLQISRVAKKRTRQGENYHNGDSPRTQITLSRSGSTENMTLPIQTYCGVVGRSELGHLHSARHCFCLWGVGGACVLAGKPRGLSDPVP